jgi:hypothetical protein
MEKEIISVNTPYIRENLNKSKREQNEQLLVAKQMLQGQPTRAMGKILIISHPSLKGVATIRVISEWWQLDETEVLVGIVMEALKAKLPSVSVRVENDFR